MSPRNCDNQRWWYHTWHHRNADDLAVYTSVGLKYCVYIFMMAVDVVDLIGGK